jgi:hypothetical protein
LQIFPEDKNTKSLGSKLIGSKPKPKLTSPICCH